MLYEDSQYCDCVEEMADQLKIYINKSVVIFEKMVSFLRLSNVTKVIYYEWRQKSFSFSQLFVSICEITGFGQALTKEDPMPLHLRSGESYVNDSGIKELEMQLFFYV